MKNKKWLILVIIGIIQIIISISILQYNKYIDNKAGKISKEVVQIIKDTTIIQEEHKESITINGNDYIGIINIPSINLELPVSSNLSNKTMKISPVRYYGDLNSNDLIICAHSYESLFKSLNNITKGDILIFKDLNNNEYAFKVEKTEIISPEDIQKMIESEYDLTLFTCTEDNQNRFTVRLNKIKT